MIKIIDYGLGNVLAFLNVYKRLGIPIEVARTEADLAEASRIILPGVGSFDHAMDLLNRSGMRPRLNELVMAERTPVLGICVGMQMLAERSEEGQSPGLGWISGVVRKFKAPATRVLRLPHMGWNDVNPTKDTPLFNGLTSEARFYFLHSYFFECKDPGAVLAEADYGSSFACAVNTDNIYGVQFHPEKSHQFGERLLKNFSEA